MARRCEDCLYAVRTVAVGAAEGFSSVLKCYNEKRSERPRFIHPQDCCCFFRSEPVPENSGVIHVLSRS